MLTTDDHDSANAPRSNLRGPIADDRAARKSAGVAPASVTKRALKLVEPTHIALEPAQGHCQRLARLKAAIAAGTYPRDSRRIAVALLGHGFAA